jgi:Cytochrome C'
MSDFEEAGVLRSAAVVSLLALSACSARDPQIPHADAAPGLTSFVQPIATIQELMQSEVDASADDIWDAVATTTSKAGEETQQPRTPEEWLAVRRNAIVLIEAANLLTVDNRKLSAAPFPAEAAGALDSTAIDERITHNRETFDEYALTLRRTAQTMLTAIDAKDPKALVAAGGVLDEVCESCHMTFWYPNQVIPPFPTKGDPRFAKVAVNPPK